VGVIFKLKDNFYQKYIKRLQDIAIATIAIILLSPMMIIVALIIRIYLSKKILFIQERPGKNEKIFRLYKFKTMSDEKDENGDLLPDCKRLTKLGRFLRSTSLDELPGLFNVLKNDMSLVGPRPLLVQYLDLYDDVQKRRHEVKPGITGLAQINGRNAISWEEKFKYDIEYVDDISFVTDWKIMLASIGKVFLRSGINAGEHNTMEVFRGSKNNIERVPQ